MQMHGKNRYVPFPRPCGATGKNAQKLHAPAFVHFCGAVLVREASCVYAAGVHRGEEPCAVFFAHFAQRQTEKIAAQSHARHRGLDRNGIDLAEEQIGKSTRLNSSHTTVSRMPSSA